MMSEMQVLFSIPFFGLLLVLVLIGLVLYVLRGIYYAFKNGVMSSNIYYFYDGDLLPQILKDLGVEK